MKVARWAAWKAGYLVVQMADSLAVLWAVLLAALSVDQRVA